MISLDQTQTRRPLQVDFMRRHSFDYEALAGEEYQVLKPDLVKVQESVGNSAFANEIKQATSRDAFFKVPLIYNRPMFSTRKARYCSEADLWHAGTCR